VRNHIKIITLLILLGTASTSIFSQYSPKITPVEGEKRKYLVDGEVYDFQEMRTFFKDDHLALTHYEKALHKKKSAKTWGYVCVGAMTVGTLAPLINPTPEDMYCDLFCLSTGEVIGLASWFIVVPITGTVALIKHFGEKGKRKKAIQLINNGSVTSWDVPSDSPQYNLGVTTNGVGVVMSF